MLTQVSLWALAEPALSTLRDEEWNDLITCQNITTHRRGQYTTGKPEKKRIVNVAGVLTWFKLGDSRSNTLHHTSPLMAKDCRKALLMLSFKQMVQVGMTNTCGNHLQHRTES